MTDITAKDIQALRQETGTGMMDAKKALVEAGGDMERAAEILREKGIAAAAKRTDRAQTEGTIGSYLHHQAGRPVIGVLVELASETDFVAKSDEFQGIANDIAMHVAAASPQWVTRDDVPAEDLDKEKDLIAAQARNEGKPDHIVDKIVEGRLNSFYKDNVLLDQVFVRSEAFEGTVGDMVQQLAVKMGENISVKRFSRIQVGAGS
ncbi:MAG: translation elongation factor Ts [Acidimicrobiia bacterium]|nr:translation elongation factor Ts [Acidimicrobiia bacterium]